MKSNTRTVFGMAVGIVALLAASIMPVQAQPGSAVNNPLGLAPPSGRPIVPIMEGAYDNGDGSFTVSFGYLNRNSEAMNIPHGEENFIEPAQFNGQQPTHFDAGRHTGVFTVTVPASMAGQSIWWHLKTGANEITKVPGRLGRMGYTLDRAPRPQGSIAPEAWFVEGGPVGTDPMGLTAEETLTARVGQPLELTIHADDPSIRDENDPRNVRGIPVRVSWWGFQGPANVTFTRHETSVAEEPAQGRRPAREMAENEVKLFTGEGTAKVYATFSEPGEYVVRGLVDNWDATDSTEGDQCCWTNMYHKVTVTP